jgi:hypothetical protein
MPTEAPQGQETNTPLPTGADSTLQLPTGTDDAPPVDLPTGTNEGTKPSDLPPAWIPTPEPAEVPDKPTVELFKVAYRKNPTVVTQLLRAIIEYP